MASKLYYHPNILAERIDLLRFLMCTYGLASPAELFEQSFLLDFSSGEVAYRYYSFERALTYYYQLGTSAKTSAYISTMLWEHKYLRRNRHLMIKRASDLCKREYNRRMSLSAPLAVVQFVILIALLIWKQFLG
jgi:hypothetical protein